MRSDIFKSWLKSKGCRFDEGDHSTGGHAHLTVKLEGKHSTLPLVGTHQDLDVADVDRILADLGLDGADMPGHTEDVRRVPT